MDHHKHKEVFTCPMHEDVVSDSPDNCPKCGMALVKSEGEQDTHGQHNHHGGFGHGSAKEFLNKFYTVTFLLIPLLIFSQPGLKILGYADFELRKYIQFAIASIIFWIGKIFFVHAKHELMSRTPGMMTLVSLGVGTGYLFSAISTFTPKLEVEFYLEIATLIWVLLFGHFLEAKSSGAAGDALQEVAKLLPKMAHVKHGSMIHEMEISDLKKGMIVIIKPGEKAPADGLIVSGSASFNESHITGESRPISKKIGSTVIAGAICNGSVEVELTRVGKNSTIGQIKNLISQAQNTKPNTQRLADKASYWLTLIAVIVSILTLGIWTLIAGQTFVFAMTLAITVLVIACPHALGLAIPTVSTIATQLAVKNGFFIKDLAKLESVKDIDTIIFDKTGTLTEGKPTVINFEFIDNLTTKIEESGSKLPKGISAKNYILSLVLAIELQSSHPIAEEVVKYISKRKVSKFNSSEFKNISGKGVAGKVKNHKIAIGNRKLMEKEKVIFDTKLEQMSMKWQKDGKSVAYISVDNKHIASFVVADKIRKESKQAITDLHNLGLQVAILSGDTKEVTSSVAKSLNIDQVFAEVLPKDKYKEIQRLQNQGKKVMMIGDGVNDAPALTQADVGVAIGTGTDVAVEAGDIILTRSNPLDTSKLIRLSRKVYRKMVENLVWAFSYNIVAIPAAAGLFLPWGVSLKPEVGALFMSLSSVIVVINAITLKKQTI